MELHPWVLLYAVGFQVVIKPANGLLVVAWGAVSRLSAPSILQGDQCRTQEVDTRRP
jgi:hypothetical protein